MRTRFFVLVSLLLGACADPYEGWFGEATEGAEERLSFQYRGSSECAGLFRGCPIEQAIAVGGLETVTFAAIDDEVLDETRGAVRVETSDPAIFLLVDDYAPGSSSVRIRATGPGHADLRIATVDGQLIDRVRIETRAAARLELDVIAPTSDPETAQVRWQPLEGDIELPLDQRASLRAVAYDAGERPLLGANAVEWSIDQVEIASVLGHGGGFFEGLTLLPYLVPAAERTEPLEPVASSAGENLLLVPNAAGDARVRATIGDVEASATVHVR